MFDFLLLVVLTFLGARIFGRFLPGSRLIGPIFLVGFVNIMGGNLSLASCWEIVFSIILGTFFGLRINKDLVKDFKKIAIPLVLLIFWYIGLTVINGNILQHLSSFDKVTSFLSVIPGGLGEVSIMALDYGADLMSVTSFQITRLISIVIMLPFLIKIFAKKRESSLEGSGKRREEDKVYKAILLAAFSLSGAVIFWMLDLPAGFLTGSLVFSAIASSTFPKYISSPPEIINNLAQLGMGALIGTSFNRESFLAIIDSYLIVLIVTAITILSSFILAYIFNKLFKWNYLTCFLGVVPGGIAPIMIMADQIEIDIGLVAVMQIVRLITAVMIIPLLYIIIL